jgi:2-polyprenyl-6-methoxyphenol hydroxylase-like FAD-dependent oxidoreductase
MPNKPMLNKRVLISGASVAGPALAYWLERYGCAVTIVEHADALRGGGQAVDFKREVHRTVLERMGILDEVHRRSTTPTDLHIIDENERVLATMPSSVMRGFGPRLARSDSGHSSCTVLFGSDIGASSFRS